MDDNGSQGSGQTADDFDRFVHLLSHDVRASMRALITLPDWIEEDIQDAGLPPVPSLMENLTLMKTHANRVDQMLVDLLDHSRIGRLDLVSEVDVNACLNEVLKELDPDTIYEITTSIEVARIVIRHRDLSLLLRALVSNAIKHNAATGARVEVGIKDADGQHIITVTDDGPGIPEAFRQKVLEPFSTLKPRDTVEGSGMGLAIVTKVAATYGGTLKWVAKPEQSAGLFAVHIPHPVIN